MCVILIIIIIIIIISSVFYLRKIIKKNSNYNIMQMYIIYLVAIFIRWLYCNQALPGPSTSGFSSPYESPWDAGKFITD